MATYKGPKGKVEAVRIPVPSEYRTGSDFNDAMRAAAAELGNFTPYLPNTLQSSYIGVPMEGQRHPARPGDYVIKVGGEFVIVAPAIFEAKHSLQGEDDGEGD